MKVRLLIITLLIVYMGCEKENPEPPSGFISKITITSSQAENVSYRTASISGSLGDTYGQTVQDYGHCWDTLQDPEISGDKTSFGNQKGTKSFSSNLTDLKPGKLYYVRAYFILADLPKYSQVSSFTTTALGLPVVQTAAISNITVSGATSGGNITHDGGDPVTVKGVCWSTNTAPTTSDFSKSVGSGTGVFEVNLTGLSPNTVYYVRAFATNAVGTAYASNEVSFKTGAAPVAAFTASPTSLNVGQIVQFTDQSTNTPTSWSWNFGDGGTSTEQNPSHTYNSAGVYSVSLNASNDFGSDSETKSGYIAVIAPGSPPIAAFIASQTNINLGETVTFTDQSANEPIIWSWNFGDGGTSSLQSPSHTYTIAGTYTVTLTATNNHGSDSETKSNYITVFAELSGSFMDARDGHNYNWVRIGDQIWMAENLAYLPSVSPSNSGSSTTAVYYVYEYAGTNVASAKATINYVTYGVLYNWRAAMAGSASSNSAPSGVQGVCPSGWHLPSDEEWKILEVALDMPESISNLSGWRGTDQGTKLKSITGWLYGGSGNNLSGFTALPGGYRFTDGLFGGLGSYGSWWSASGFDAMNSWIRDLGYENSTVGRYEGNNAIGYSVRCVKD